MNIYLYRTLYYCVHDLCFGALMLFHWKITIIYTYIKDAFWSGFGKPLYGWAWCVLWWTPSYILYNKKYQIQCTKVYFVRVVHFRFQDYVLLLDKLYDYMKNSFEQCYVLDCHILKFFLYKSTVILIRRTLVTLSVLA